MMEFILKMMNVAAILPSSQGDVRCEYISLLPVFFCLFRLFFSFFVTHLLVGAPFCYKINLFLA